MDAYIFQSDIICHRCGADRCSELQRNGVADNGDSDTYPQGPYGSGGGEADTPQHCGDCGTFLDNPLTQDGSIYVKAAWRSFVEEGRGNMEVLQEWRDAYVNEWSEWCEATESEIDGNEHTDLAVRRFHDLADS